MSSIIFARIEEWRKELLDTSKRNRLINFKLGKTGGLVIVRPRASELWRLLVAGEAVLKFPWKSELTDVADSALEEGENHEERKGEVDRNDEDGVQSAKMLACLNSPRLRPSDLLSKLTDKQLDVALKRLALKSREAEMELGVNTLFVAFGLLRWYDSETSKEPNLSPLLLVPIRISRDTIESPWALNVEEDEIRRNDTLAERMKGDFRLGLPSLEEVRGERDDDFGLFDCYAKAVADRIQHHRRWEVLIDEAALGTFHFQKLAMWEDLGRNQERVASHRICQAIADDERPLPPGPRDLPKAESLDNLPPQQTVHILDADSSQQAAIEAVKRGADLVLDGPPGSGKSQTIANLIAEFLAAGKKILFVSEKAAALDVVKRRLDEKGLGDFCLDLHSLRAHKKDIYNEFKRCLNLSERSYRDYADQLRELEETRARLNAYVRALHAPREPLRKSPFQAHGELAQANRLNSKTRCPVPSPSETDENRLLRITAVLDRLPDCQGVLKTRDQHPWRGFQPAVHSLSLQHDLEFHVGRLAKSMPEAVGIAARLAALGLTPKLTTQSGWIRGIEDSKRILAVPQSPTEWFEGDPATVSQAMIDLNDFTRRLRRVLTRLPEFSKSALCVQGIVSIPDRKKSSKSQDIGLLDRSSLGLRAAGARFQEVENLLRDNLKHAVAADRAAKEIRECLKIGGAGFKFRNLRSFKSIGQVVLKAGVVPKSWWSEVERKELLSVASQANHQSREAEQLRSELLNVYKLAALANPDLGPIAGLPESRSAAKARLTMKEVRERLIRQSARLQRLAELTESSESAIRSLTELLDSPESPRGPAQAQIGAERIERSLKLAPIAHGHWGRNRRAEVGDAMAKAVRFQAEAEIEARNLEDRASTEALAGMFDQEIVRALAYRSWFFRWFSGWRNVRDHLRLVFPMGLPGTKILFADLKRLVKRRRALDDLAKLTDSYKSDWVMGVNESPNPEATEAALARAAEAENLHSATPQFREALAQSGLVLRASVSSTVSEALSELAGLHKIYCELVEDASILGHPVPPLWDSAGFNDLRSWSGEQADWMQRQSEALDRARSTMIPGGFDALTRQELTEWDSKRREYKDRTEYVRGIKRDYGERLCLVAVTEEPMNWKAIVDRLECVEFLVQCKHSELIPAMAPGGYLDWSRLDRSTKGLAQALKELETAWQRLGLLCSVEEWNDPETSLPRSPVADFLREFTERVLAAEQARVYAERLVPLLREGVDILWPTLEERTETLYEGIALLVRVNELREHAKVQASLEDVEERDWTDDAKIADALLKFLEVWKRPLGLGVIRGLSDSQARAEMQVLVDQTTAVRLGGFDESWMYLTTEIFAPFENVSTGIVFEETSLEALAVWLRDRTRDIPAARDWVRYRDMEREAEAMGITAVLEEVRRDEVRADEARLAYRARFLEKWLDWVYEQTPELRDFETQDHERWIGRFIGLDKLAIAAAPERVRNLLLARVDRPSLLTDEPPDSSELGLLIGQVERKRNHWPLRKLFEKVPSILLRLKPCLMMSPLAVSTVSVHSPNRNLAA